MGEMIGNKYEILKLIGQGGMSKVYLAMDKRLNKPWAIKEISKKGGGEHSEIIVNSLLTEVNMIKRLDHPSIPRIVDIIEDDAKIYVVMDFIEGKTLGSVLESSGPQPQEVVVEWAKELCDVLEYLHTRQPPIIYRDMKPSNIILTPNGNIKIIDFGIAREYKENNISDTVVLGTRGYAAPEQYGGKGQTDPRTDIYCLGVTLYHLVTGHNPCEPPYEIYPIRHWNSQLSPELESIIEKCTQLNPDNRYQSCSDLRYDLSCFNHLECSHKTAKKNLISLIRQAGNNISIKALIAKNKRYINEDSSEGQVGIDNARYLARVLANIQNDEKNCSTIKGPDYNE